MNSTFPSDQQIGIFQQGLLDWAAAGNLREFPWRDTNSPYRVFVAEILLGATLAQKVVPIYSEFIRRYPNFEALSRADVSELADVLEPLGLHNRRAQAFVRIGSELAGQAVPRTESELTDLPYVGPYAANATLCFAFGDPRPIVDPNVIRVYEHSFGVDLGDLESSKAWAFARRALPSESVREYNLALLDFAATVCTSRLPNCDIYFNSDTCHYYSSTRAGDETTPNDG